MSLERRTPLRAQDEKLCACGCGELAGFYRKTAVRGLPRTYIHGHHGRKQGRYVFEDRGHETHCWIWQLGLDSDGYAQTTLLGGSRRAARVYYEAYNGPILDRLVIDHLCRVRACVNPEHLEAVTNRENLLRGEGIAAINAAKTHCKHGHPFDEVNTRWNRGKRYCRACDYRRYHGKEAPWL